MSCPPLQRLGGKRSDPRDGDAKFLIACHVVGAGSKIEIHRAVSRLADHGQCRIDSAAVEGKLGIHRGDDACGVRSIGGRRKKIAPFYDTLPR